MNWNWDVQWKDKETGKYIAVLSYLSFSDKKNTKVKYYDDSGICLEVSLSEFHKKFEPVECDGLYVGLGSAMVEACIGNSEFRRLADALLRKLDPGYFNIGNIVYFLNPSTYFNCSSSGNYIPRRYGIEYPYKIISQENSKDFDNVLLLGLVRLGNNSKNPDFEIPVYLDRLEPGDAYYNLRRYDKPF